MKTTRLVVLGAVWVGWVAAPAPAQDAAGLFTEAEEIKLEAKELTYDQKGNEVTARGDVIIRRGQTRLEAQEVQFNRSTNEASAVGDVRLTNPEGTVFADSVTLDLDDETGVLEGARIEVPRLGYSISGKRVEKGIGQSYSIQDGYFTTCRCPDGCPSWSITGEKLDVTLGGLADLTGGTFNILDKAVFYVPRAVFPVNVDRQSGLLRPRFGASNRRGFQVLLPYYWAIDKSQDATVAFDAETEARIGLLAEHRHQLSRAVNGRLGASYFNESFRGQARVGSEISEIPEHRWSVNGEQTARFGQAGVAYADGLVVSDDAFLREINAFAFEHSRDVAFRTLRFTRSRAGAVYGWDRAALRAEGDFYQNLIGPDSQTLQRTPDAELVGQELLGGLVLADIALGATNFQRGSGVDGLRLDIEPSLTVPLPLGRYAFGSVQASVRETAYYLTESEVAGQTLPDAPTELKNENSRELVRVRAQVGTMLGRVYPVNWRGLEKVKHTIEPMLEYLYIPAVSQDELPTWDGVDRVNRRSLLTYGVVTRLLGKFSGEPEEERADEDDGRSEGGIREMARLWLAQSYDFGRDIDDLLRTGRGADHFSDIDFGGRLQPASFFTVRFESNFDTGKSEISAANVGFYLEDPRRRREEADSRLGTRTSVGASYRFLPRDLLQEFDSSVVVALTDWAGFIYSGRYDLVENRFLDNHFGIRLVSQCDCWAFEMAVTDRSNPQEVEFRALLTLVGLGSDSGEERVAARPVM
jgi:LPS-assembly protein